MNIKKIIFSILLSGMLFCVKAQYVNVSSLGTGYSQDFNTLDTLGTTLGNVPVGWWIAEAPGNFTYRAGNGSANAGDTYSFGTPSSTDRALGSLASGSVVPNFGSRYINTTGSTISSFTVDLTMEQWRSGGRTGLDSLYFFYAVNNNIDSLGFVRINTGTWTKAVEGDLLSKVTQATAAAFDGNLPANKQAYSFTITGITVNNGDTLYLRWRDPNVGGSDDGLAIDDYTFTAHSSGPVVTPPAPITNLTLVGLTRNTAQVSYTKNVNYLDSTMSILVFAKKDTAVIAGTPTISNANYTASSNLTILETAYQHDTNAFCIYKGDANSFTLSGMDVGRTYHLLAYVVTDEDSLYSTSAITSGASSPMPASVTSLSFTSGGQTSARLKWTKPAEYVNGTYTTVVFVKQDNDITDFPQLTFAGYIASADFSAPSSSLDDDSLAKCVFNGDADSVWVTGLTVGTSYFAHVYVYRGADDIYSLPAPAFVQTEGLVPLPSPATNLVVAHNGYTALDVSWTKDVSYVDSVYTTLVFAKANTGITTGPNTTVVTDYIDSLNFGKGSLYQHDSMAFCIYKGDANSITTTGLMDLTQYHFNIYIVRESDSVYSNALVGNGTTLEAPPTPVSGIGAVALSQTSARLSWVKSPSYQNSSMTTLVFVKAGTINNGTVSKGVSGYTANTLFGNGTPFDADPLAYCVFKADTNFVTITGLLSQTNYEFEVFTMRDVDSAESLGVKASFASQGPPPLYAINQINSVNTTTGVADSVNVKVRLKGIVYGFNQRATGIQFLIRDTTGGMTLFNASKNFGYTTVTEGDEVEAEGSITTFRGLLELTMDTMVVKSIGNSLKQASKVAVLNELTENDLVRLDSVQFATARTGNWPTSSTNIAVVTPANDTVTIRVLSTSALAGTPLPTTPMFSVIGIGSQNTSVGVAPYPFTGYQLFPRSQGDIIEVAVPQADTLSPFNLVTPTNNDTIEITNLNLGDTVTISWTASTNSDGISATEYTFLLDTAGGDFSNPFVVVPTASATTFTLTKGDILTELIQPSGLGTGGIFAASWMVEAASNTLIRNSTQTFTVYILNSMVTGLHKTTQNINFTIWPNPATGYFILQGVKQHDELEIVDITGKVLLSQKITTSEMNIPIADYKAGVYFVKVKNGQSVSTRKLLVN